MLCCRTRAASAVDLPGMDPHCRGCMSKHIVAWAERREATILSRIFESVRRRTITLKEAGESYQGLPGLSRTIPSAFLREGG